MKPVQILNWIIFQAYFCSKNPVSPYFIDAWGARGRRPSAPRRAPDSHDKLRHIDHFLAAKIFISQSIDKTDCWRWLNIASPDRHFDAGIFVISSIWSVDMAKCEISWTSSRSNIWCQRQVTHNPL